MLRRSSFVLFFSLKYNVCSGSIFTAYLVRDSILLLPCLMVYYTVPVLFLLAFWCPCMAINVSIQYNGGFLTDVILLTQCYLHRGTRIIPGRRYVCVAFDPT